MQTIEWPFLAGEALESGALTFRELRRFHAAVYPGVWVPREADLSPQQRARAAWLWSRRRGVLAGLSAAALLGTKWIESDCPAELIHTNRRPPNLIRVHTDTLLAGETAEIDGLPLTTAARTAFDIGRRLPLKQGVQRLDALMNATDVKVSDVEAVIARHPGARELRQLAKTLDLVDAGAESPYESLTRLLLLQAGFPRPQTQIPIYDDYGNVFARIDIGWPEFLVGVDFEGAHHWTDPKQREWDLERAALIAERGWLDIRLASRTLHNRPRVFLDRVGAALVDRGCPKTW
ncbi:hypothetical protein [Mycolicibacter icosiumassiliensis]|uniref:hypothetical protein n=1 Tax=Mycolicibacter icosiumassiliensis TaxID=1792835 RepID=UPI000829A4E7|nr:hypothetical protein [Mycolicibacter icosiumassiliensis]